MSDEEDESMSEAFSASEDEWKPVKDVRHGTSSDDDDSDFEDDVADDSIVKKKETTISKSRSGIRQISAKKRKPLGQSLRAKLYNKYRPPPKTITSPSNSPSASTSRKASKNVEKPNESAARSGVQSDDSSSESSVEDYLVKPSQLDLQSSFFDVNAIKTLKGKSPTPVFDCNAGLTKLSDSGSEDNSESSADEHNNQKKDKAFDFSNLLQKANSLERAKETIAKRAAESKSKTAKQQKASKVDGTENAALDVNSLLALGEMQNSTKTSNDSGADEAHKNAPQKLNKTKSTRVKRHTKTRPTSTVLAGDTDDSDWEDVAGEHDVGDTTLPSSDVTNCNNLEIHVELPSRQRTKKVKQLQDLENALKRKLNRDLKERQLVMHKTSLLCLFGRSYFYNRLLNDTTLMKATLKLLPSKNAYPPERGTELKYYQSLVTWYKTVIKLQSQNLYPVEMSKRTSLIKKELLQQIDKKEARSKQDAIFIFIILLRGMGLQCRLVVNMQPLPLRPSQADLLKIKLKRDGNDGKKGDGNVVAAAKKPKLEETKSKPVKEETKSKPVKEDKREIVEGKQKTEKNKRKVKSNNEEDIVAQSAKIKPEKIVGKMPPPEADKSTTSSEKDKENKGTSIIVLREDYGKSNKRITNKNSKEEITNETSQELVQGTEKGNAEKQQRTGGKRAVKVQLSKLKDTQTESFNEDKKNKSVEHKEEENIQNLCVIATPIARRTRQASTEKPKEQKDNRVKTKPPKISIASCSENVDPCNTVAQNEKENAKQPRSSRSISPKLQISPNFLQTETYKEKFAFEPSPPPDKSKKKLSNKIKISPEFLRKPENIDADVIPGRILRSRQKQNDPGKQSTNKAQSTQRTIPQLDGGDDTISHNQTPIKQIKKRNKDDDSDEDFEPSPPKRPKQAPLLPKTVQKLRKDRRVLSTDDDDRNAKKANKLAADLWIEVYSDREEKWICIDLWTGKLDSVESIRKSASNSFAYVFAFQNDLSLKDVTARYCPHWTTTVRKSRVESAWLNAAISSYRSQRTKRDIREDAELRRIHEEKPLPTSISDFKDHPLYALERHLLKFQAIYPPEPPTLGFIRSEPIYSRDCIHTLHSREIWLKQARTVKLGEQPYKIVKARPKWDRITQTVIKDQPLEIFGYWQTEDYDPPTAENGIVPRNAYGNVELFKECMLPKKTVHLRLNGLNRICKKLNIDCVNAVVGFDFHQGACHPTYDGFVVCEEFAETVKAAWEQDQQDQERKDQEKYEARVYGNWKKLIRGLLIKERLKKKYNF